MTTEESAKIESALFFIHEYTVAMRGVFHHLDEHPTEQSTEELASRANEQIHRIAGLGLAVLRGTHDVRDQDLESLRVRPNWRLNRRGIDIAND